MMELGALGFLTPWALAALAALPALWWLLRLLPPPPRRVYFPAMFLLRGLEEREVETSRMPWWLLLLRLLLAVLVIMAVAHPVLRPAQALLPEGEDAALVLVVDNGWSAAANWEDITAKAAELIGIAERQRRGVVLIPTAGNVDAPPAVQNAAKAQEAMRGLRPVPWAPEARLMLQKAMGYMDADDRLIWLSGGVVETPGAGIADIIAGWGGAYAFVPEPKGLPVLLRSVELGDGEVEVKVERLDARQPETVLVRGLDRHGQGRFVVEARFGGSDLRATAEMRLPAAALEDIARAEIVGGQHAAAVALYPSAPPRKTIGIVGAPLQQAAVPLLTPEYFAGRAMQPFAELLYGDVGTLTQSMAALIVLPDSGALAEADRGVLENWMQKGGVLVRFAGPKLAASGDSFVPVPLRSGGRTLSGALSWEKPLRLAPFPPSSIFYGLAVPEDVRVEKQVLAEPTLALEEHTQATLEDGTPIVTLARKGRGALVLVHTTANTEWSNLALSGLFVDMLRRLSQAAEGGLVAPASGMLEPQSLLDGFGKTGASWPDAKPVAAEALASLIPSAAHPPGMYGNTGGAAAFNLGSAATAPAPVALPSGLAGGYYGKAAGSVDLRVLLLLAAMVLCVVDLLVSLVMRGMLPAWRKQGALVAVAFLVCVFHAPHHAEAGALEAASRTRLAYVKTGRADIDRVSEQGLKGLTLELAARTSFEGEEPDGVNIERDEIVFYPVLYWPVVAGMKQPSGSATDKLKHYVHAGGVVLFDTKGERFVMGEGMRTSAIAWLGRLLPELDHAPLITIPEGHVLGKSFYLLQTFPGRWNEGSLIVENPGQQQNDGVASLVIGSNDWAAAWAVEGNMPGRYPYAVVPGGERQREMAYRFGVNLVMMAVTGNYKTDQIHLPAIMERLGGHRRGAPAPDAVSPYIPQIVPLPDGGGE